MRKPIWLQLFCHKMSQGVFNFAMFMRAPKVHNTYRTIVKQHCGFQMCPPVLAVFCEDSDSLTNIPLVAHLCKECSLFGVGMKGALLIKSMCHSVPGSLEGMTPFVVL